MPKVTDIVESFMERAIDYAAGFPEEARPQAITTYVQACALIDAGRRINNGLDDIAASITDIAYTIKRGINDANEEPTDERSPDRTGT